MSLASPPRKYTAADLLTMPEGDRFELVDGELVESDRNLEASWISGQVLGLMSNWCADDGSRGWAFPSQATYQCFPWDENRVRKPDASFIARERLPDGPLPIGHCHVAPDLAVEVVSPNDLYYDVEQKVEEYLCAGVRVVWVINPPTRTVMVHRSDSESPSRLAEAAELSDEPALPGFRCRVADFFPPHRVAAPR